MKTEPAPLQTPRIHSTESFLKLPASWWKAVFCPLIQPKKQLQKLKKPFASSIYKSPLGSPLLPTSHCQILDDLTPKTLFSKVILYWNNKQVHIRAMGHSVFGLFHVSWDETLGPSPRFVSLDETLGPSRRFTAKRLAGFLRFWAS